MDPKVWGPHLWSSLHYIALGYPDSPSPVDKYNYQNFYESLHTILPCEECATHYKALVQEMKITPHLNDKYDLFKWTVNVHNAVNQRLGKPQMSYNDALRLYKPSSNAGVVQKTSNIRALHVLLLLSVCIAVGICVFMVKRPRKKLI